MNNIIAEATIAKVLGRWAQHARHDLMGAWTPMSMDLAALAARNARSAVTSEDIASFVMRMKDSLKCVSRQSENLALMVGQDRRPKAQVSDAIHDIAQKLRIRFAAVDCELAAEDLGEETRYDLYMMLLATLMALEDRKGSALRLTMRVARDDAKRLLVAINTAPLEDSGEQWHHGGTVSDPERRIDLVDVDCLAAYLGFRFTSTSDGGELLRV